MAEPMNTQMIGRDGVMASLSAGVLRDRPRPGSGGPFHGQLIH